MDKIIIEIATLLAQKDKKMKRIQTNLSENSIIQKDLDKIEFEIIKKKEALKRKLFSEK